MDPKVEAYHEFNEYSNKSDDEFDDSESPKLRPRSGTDVFNYSTNQGPSSPETGEITDSNDENGIRSSNKNVINNCKLINDDSNSQRSADTSDESASYTGCVYKDKSKFVKHKHKKKRKKKKNKKTKEEIHRKHHSKYYDKDDLWYDKSEVKSSHCRKKMKLEKKRLSDKLESSPIIERLKIRCLTYPRFVYLNDNRDLLISFYFHLTVLP